jgi:hypothetical protein
MRIAVLCDIQGNLPALRAALVEVDDAGVDLVAIPAAPPPPPPTANSSSTNAKSAPTPSATRPVTNEPTQTRCSPPSDSTAAEPILISSAP